jgi:hypothetical protein
VIKELLAYVRELEADKGRLDWLEEHIKEWMSIDFSWSKERGPQHAFFAIGWNRVKTTAPSVRQAIDNAREQ